MIADRNFLSPDLVADPYPYLHALRAEDPVHWSGPHQAWILTRYDDVESAFLDERLSAARVRSPLPATVIAKLLGVPEEDLGRFQHWSQDVSSLVFGGSGGAGRRERAVRGLLALERYFRALLDRRQREPADDLLSELARAEEKGDVLSADEVIATCALLLFAGHETTANLLSTGFLHLDRHPHERRWLAENPALASRAVEELLRFDGPTKLQVRMATQDMELRGK